MMVVEAYSKTLSTTFSGRRIVESSAMLPTDNRTAEQTESAG